MPKKQVVLLNEPGDINQLLVPMARIFYLPPPDLMTDLINELPYMLGGKAVKPEAPIVWRDDQGVTMLPGFGVTEAAELQDMAYKLAEKRREDWRARFGFEPRKTFDSRFREHMEERIKNPAQKRGDEYWREQVARGR